MNIFDKIGGLFNRNSAERAISDFHESRSHSMLGLELKKAYDLQRVGIQGRPQYPSTDINSLFGWHRRNELVYACIEKICQAAQDPEPIVEVLKGDTWERDDSHPLRRLLMKPNPLDTYETFIAAWMVSEHVAGEFYAEIVRSPDGLPVQLWPLDPSCMYPIPGKGKDGSPIVGYEFKMGSEKRMLKPEDVLVRQNKQLTNKFRGLAPLAVALGSVDAHQAQNDFVRAFFTNSGVPAGILKYSRNLTDQEAEQRQQRWRMRFGRGGTNERGIAVLDQSVDFQKVGSSPDEIESDAVRWAVESSICMVFGVPPILVGAYVGQRWANQRAGAREAQSDFWMNKMSPLFKGLRSFLQWNLLSQFIGIEQIYAGKIRVNWDMGQVSALQEDVDAIHTRARENVKAGIWTLNEGRGATGQDEDPDGDYYIRSMTVLPQSGEQALVIAEGRVDQGKPKQLTGETVDGEIVDDEKALQEIARKVAASKNGNGHAPKDDLGLLFKITDAHGNIVQTLPVKVADGIATIPGFTVPSTAPESKVIEWEGLKLSREPSELEKSIDLKAIAGAQDEGGQRVKGVLLKLRESLIKEAIETLSSADPASLHEIVLTPQPKTYKDLRKELDQLYTTGRRLISSEAAAQGKKRSRVLSDEKQAKNIPEDDDALNLITDGTVSRVVNQVQSTAAGIVATLAILRVAEEERRQKIESAMEESSSSAVEGFAAGVANAALQMGRQAEMEARADEIDRYVYSAILDANLCEQCEPYDGQESKDISELPNVPNENCLGGDRCRCMIVAVFSTESA